MTAPPPLTGFDTLKNSARQHEQASQWDEALAIYQQLLTQNDQDPDLHNDVALAYEKIGKGDPAEHHYRRALALDPHFYAAAYNLAQLIRATGDRDKSLQVFAETYSLASTPGERQDVLLQVEAVTGETVKICVNCKCVSPYVPVFQSVDGWLLCPYCAWEKGHQSLKRRQLTFILAMGVIAVALVLTSQFPWLVPFHYLLGMSIGFLIALIITIVVHELGHAIATLATGGNVPAIVIGTGPLLTSFKIGKTAIVINSYPIAGVTALYYSPKAHIRLRAFLAVLAGPLASLGVGVAALYWAQQVDHFVYYFIPNTLIWMNVLAFVTNLIPYQTRQSASGVTPLPSDGLNLLSLVTNPDWAKRYSLFYYLTAYGTTHPHTPLDYDESLRAAEEGLVIMGDEPNLLATAGNMAMELGQLDKARDYFERAVALGSDDMGVRGMTLNNLAYCQTVQGEPQTALPNAKHAFWLIPWSPYVIGTYGATLIELGSYEQGIENVMEAFHRHTMDYAKASNLAYAAKGHALAGRHEEGMALLQQAESYPVQPLIVRRIREELT